MPVVRSAGIIIFRKTSQGKRYLIVRSARDIKKRGEFWDIPKGELEKGEKKGMETAVREVKEETGLDNFTLIPDFKYTARYFTRRGGKPILKFVAVFLAKAHKEEVKLSWEHDAFEWAPLGEATKKLTTMREAVKKADEFLQRQGS